MSSASYSKRSKRRTLEICREVAAQYAEDPVGWIERYIDFSGSPIGGLTPQQVAIAKAIQTDRFVAVSAGGGIGKTAIAVLLGLWGITAHPEAMIGATAPVGPQLSTVLWPEFDKWISRCSLAPIIRYTSKAVTIKGWAKWGIFKRTAAKEKKDVSDTLAGLHAPWMMFIVDEAAGVRNEVFTAVDGAMTQPESRALLISNPTSAGGYYYDIITSPDGKGYRVFHFSSKDSPLVTPEYERRIAERWGKDSPMYRIKVLGLPVEAQHSVVVDPFLFDRVVAEQREWDEGTEVVGIDVGAEGPEPTVAVRKVGRSVVEWKEIHESDPELAAEEIIDWLSSRGGPKVLVVDAIGVGFGLYKALARRAPWRVVKWEGSKKAENEEMFDSARTELFWKLHKNFSKLHFPTPPPERLRKELANLRFSFEKDKVGMIPKKQFVGEMGFSPNYADALAMTMAFSTFTWATRRAKIIPPRVGVNLMVDSGISTFGRFR